MRTFIAGKTKIDVIAHISREDLELDRLVLSRFEGSETIANAAFRTLVDRYRGVSSRAPPIRTKNSARP